MFWGGWEEKIIEKGGSQCCGALELEPKWQQNPALTANPKYIY